MVEVTLKDIGYYDVSHTTGNPDTEEIAYGSDGAKGTALNLHAISIGLKITPFITKEPSPQLKDDNSATKRFEVSEADTNGLDFPTWTVKGQFSTKLQSHMQEFGRLIHMCKTKGYKQLGFILGSRWDANGNGLLESQADIINYSHFGEREYDAEATKTVNYVNVRIGHLDVDQVVKDGTKITYTLELVETDAWA